MTEADYISKIVEFYNSSWSVFTFVYGTTWAFKIVKRVLINV